MVKYYRRQRKPAHIDMREDGTTTFFFWNVCLKKYDLNDKSIIIIVTEPVNRQTVSALETCLVHIGSNRAILSHASQQVKLMYQSASTDDDTTTTKHYIWR